MGAIDLLPTDATPALWGAAVHEGGHAVVAQVLGVPVHTVLVRPDGSGRTHMGLDRANPETRIIVTAAGPLAQLRLAWGSHSDPWGERNRDDGDAACIDRDLGRFPTHRRIDLLRRYCDLAEQAIVRHRRAIERLARVLAARPGWEHTGRDVSEALSYPPWM